MNNEPKYWKIIANSEYSKLIKDMEKKPEWKWEESNAAKAERTRNDERSNNYMPVHNRPIIQSKNSAMNSEFKAFADGFSRSQKSAILSFVSVVIWADNPMNKQEEAEMRNILAVLCIEESRLNSDIDFIQEWDEIAEVLRTLNNSHLGWLIVTIHNLMLADGAVNDKEIAIVEAMFSQIGVDDKRYIEEVQKANAFMKHFLGR